MYINTLSTIGWYSYFGGGTLAAIAADAQFAIPRLITTKVGKVKCTTLHDYYEDGTVDFFGIAG